MKPLKKITLFFTVLLMSTITFAGESDSLGVIGDNLDLNAVLDAFKNSESPEAFEKTINDQNQKINNLDLDEDGTVDYIQVIDNSEEGAHAIILRIDLSEAESQDVAVIEIEKTDDNSARIQIVGDEEIYGTNYIIEPIQESTNTKIIYSPHIAIFVNVWHWRCVKFVYGPRYVRYVSPYRWHRYPKYWKPWRPYQWTTYRNFHKHHRNHYHVTHVHYGNKAHKVYHKHRKTCAKIKHHKKHHSHKGHANHNGHKANNHKNMQGHKTNGQKKQNQQSTGKKNQNQKTNNKKGTQSKKKSTSQKKGSPNKRR